MKLLIAGTGRDIEKYWKNTMKSLDIIFNSVDDYVCVLVESNSSDNTLQCMKGWSNNNPKRIILSLGKLEDNSRTVRIAKSRNTYLDYFKNNLLYDTYDYLLVLDLDDRLNIEDNFKGQLESCFKINDWDAISSNRNKKYFDIWALRSNSEILNCNYDCWANERKILKVNKYKKTAYRAVKNFSHLEKNISRNFGFIECFSAFGGMTLYKTKSIINNRYNGNTTCEHIEFHKGLKMYINSEFISG